MPIANTEAIATINNIPGCNEQQFVLGRTGCERPHQIGAAIRPMEGFCWAGSNARRRHRERIGDLSP